MSRKLWKQSCGNKAVETKQLSPRLAEEWFCIPNTAVYRHVAKKYAKFELLSVQYLVKEAEIIVRSC